MESNDNILAAISRTDLSRLAIPKFHNLMISEDLTHSFQLIAKQMSKVNEAHQSAISELANRMRETSDLIEQLYQPQVKAFQVIAQKLQPLINQHTIFAQDFSKIATQINPTLEAIKTLSSFNAYQRYKETYEEFGGDLDPENITKEDIEQTIENNSEIIREVNEAIIRSENEGVTPGDVPQFIYSILVKRVPHLKKQTYSMLVLIFCIVVLIYQLHSDYLTNRMLKQQTKTLEAHSKDHEEIKDSISDNKQDIKVIQSKVDSTNTVVYNLQEKIENYQEETSDKLDLILEVMRKQYNEK